MEELVKEWKNNTYVIVKEDLNLTREFCLVKYFIPNFNVVKILLIPFTDKYSHVDYHFP